RARDAGPSCARSCTSWPSVATRRPTAACSSTPSTSSRWDGRPLWPSLALTQREGRIAVRDQDERVPDHAVVPANHSLDEVEDAARVAPGEQDREPGESHDEEHRKYAA